MRTSLNNIKAIDDYLLGHMSPGNALLFEANMLLNKSLVNDIEQQQKTYAMIRQYGRQNIKDEIIAVQNTLAAAPQHRGFMQQIIKLFKNISMNPDYSDIIEKAYMGFNSRDIDSVLGLMHPDIHWPKAFEGGYVIGHEAIRDYWTRQWSEINPQVEPVTIIEHPDGKVEVDVYQLVKDLDGNILFDGNVKHVYAIKDGLLRQMDIE